jgi:RraA family protein
MDAKEREEREHKEHGEREHKERGEHARKTPTLGCRILRRRIRVSPSLIEAARGLPLANVSDVMNRMSGDGGLLRPMHDGTPLAGAALTVRTRAGDNLLVHKAIDLAEPGDVIVVDAGGATGTAIIGEIMVTYARRRGVAGFVIYGAVRDAAALKAQDLPVFAVGVSHRGPYKDGPGEINVPVVIGGMVVMPGDLVLGDTDGVLAVPALEAEAVIAAARAKQAAEAETLRALREGRGIERGWVDAALARIGCAIEDG